jgi:hypothetical protein
MRLGRLSNADSNAVRAAFFFRTSSNNEGLASLWEEQARSIRATLEWDSIASEQKTSGKRKGTNSKQRVGDKGNSSDFNDDTEGQGSNNQDDPLVFI